MIPSVTEERLGNTQIHSTVDCVFVYVWACRIIFKEKMSRRNRYRSQTYLGLAFRCEAVSFVLEDNDAKS